MATHFAFFIEFYYQMTNQNLKSRLIILSDLWGKGKSDWVKYYTETLEQYFEIKYYDCCELAEIDISKYEEDYLHQQFINGGIEKAVENLVFNETEKVYIMAFSIGGFIAWKAMQSGLPSENLFAVSSTRLRNERQKPRGFIQLFYGENDAFQPDENWFLDLNLEIEIFKNEDHNFYQTKNAGKSISQQIIQHLKNSK